jgi:hypothetical protein
MKEQIQKHARKHIKDGCYLKVTLGHRGLNSITVRLDGMNVTKFAEYVFDYTSIL